MTYSTTKSYDDVITALRASTADGSLVVALLKQSGGMFTAAEFTAAVDEAAKTAEKPSGFFLFAEFAHGAW